MENSEDRGPPYACPGATSIPRRPDFAHPCVEVMSKSQILG